VLGEDNRHVEALKMRAMDHIEADRVEQALLDLRTAITEAPRDPEVMTIMAMAHEREGARELAGERLARAVEASNFGIAESLRYARFQIGEGRLGPAESTMLDALRRAPQNVELLLTLGQIHLQRQDWTRARQVVGLLRDLADPAAREAAAGLELAALQGEGRTPEAIGLLEGLASESADDLRIRLALVQTHLAAGDVEAAQAQVDAVLAEDPESLAGRMMQAALHVLGGEIDAAEELYRGVIAERPELREPYQILFALMNGLGREDEARALLAAGIEATERDAELVNIEAGLLYAEGKHEEAIARYEELYARDTSNVVIANNLASILTMHRDDDASLERAFQVARRLRGTEVPHFQDTYGWILVRRGDHEQALTYLEPAAAALEADPLVQYHLATAYGALERWDDAIARYTRVLDLAGTDSALPQVADARAQLDAIARRQAEAPAEQ
jgi:cellulose synthase operon protein C